MPRLCSIFVLVLMPVACGAPPTGTLKARIDGDVAPLTTEDGWSLTFTHVVLAVSGLTVSGGGVSGLASSGLSKPKLIDFAKSASVELTANTAAEARAYDTISLTIGRGSGDENVNVDTTTLDRIGTRAIYVEGTAMKQSTTRQFQLGLPVGATFSGCTPAVTVTAQGTSTVAFRVRAERLFHDDAGKVRFEAWATADTAPQDGIVLNVEAAGVMTSSLPSGQYSATGGSLQTVLEKRSLQLVGLGDSGSCTGAR